MRSVFFVVVFVVTTLCFSSSARAAELITNGGFETGNFTGWTAVNAAGSFRNWAVTGSGFGGNDGGAFVPVPNATNVISGSFNAWNGVTANANSPYTLTQQITIPIGVNVRMTWLDRYQMNHTQFCTTGCGTATYSVQILNTSDVLLQTLYIVNTPTNTNSNTGWVSHLANLTAYGGQTIRIRFRAINTVTLAGPGQLEIDAVSVQTLQPTAANVTVGGRVATSEGQGVSRASVTLTSSTGVTKNVLTNQFGYYKFDEVDVGETYTIAVNSKRYFFANSPRLVTVNDELTDMDFTASP